MVITKSVSRFARNTVTLLETVRELKALGVDVYFEEQNIHSLSGDGELMLTILASYAQEESRSVSENCKWRIRKSYEVGKPVTWRFLYGYRIQKGEIVIHPQEAEIVREIFDSYLYGMATADIAASLREREIPCFRGGNWTPKRVIQLLRNEKYAGNALLQKRFVVDHLSKKAQRNMGQLPAYFAEGTHPAIISPVKYQKTREHMQRHITANAHMAMDQAEYQRQYDEYEARYNETKRRIADVEVRREALTAKRGKLLGYLDMLRKQGPIRTFNETLWCGTVDQLRILKGGTMRFIFKDGAKVEG